MDIVIHQLDEMPWVIEANPGRSAKISLHLAYHNEEDHYSSVVPGLFGEEAKQLPTVKVIVLKVSRANCMSERFQML